MTPPPAMPRSAMVFAAGLGTRMRPITDTIPKPLVVIGGRAMLDHTLDRLAEAGVATAVVNVHYRADQIEAHLRGRHTPAIVISDERTLLLDQAGGIRKALRQLGDEPFYICNTDALWTEGDRPNLRHMARLWRPEIMDVLLLVAGRETSIGVDWPGDFSMSDDGRLNRRREGETVPFVYAGIGIVKPELFAALKEEPVKLAPFFFRAADQGRLHGCVLDGRWLHVGTPEAVREAEHAMEQAAV